MLCVMFEHVDFFLFDCFFTFDIFMLIFIVRQTRIGLVFFTAAVLLGLGIFLYFSHYKNLA